MRLFKKVAIIGTGLIGGSLALEIRRNRLANKVIGVSRHAHTIRLAKKRKIIDEGSIDIRIIRGADLVVLATPVKTILALAPLVKKIAAKDCIVTDVGSTKEKIVSRLEKIFPGRFIGSHPLAGSEKRSVSFARKDLFKNSFCILVPGKKASRAAIVKIKKLWKKTGAKVIFLPAGAHDRALAFVSHLPHIVAFSLMNTVPPGALKFASGGLKDTTRIAASESELWTDIFLSNKNLLKTVSEFEKNLKQIVSAIRRKDRSLLTKIISAAKKKRESLN